MFTKGPAANPLSRWLGAMRRQPLWVWIGCAFPAVMALWLIATYCVNYPAWDDWAYDYGVARYLFGEEPDWRYLIAKHGSHIVVVNKVLYAGLGAFGGWDLRLACYLNFLVVGVTFLLVMRLFITTNPTATTSEKRWFAIYTAWCLFSLIQWRLFLSAWALCWLALPLLLRAGIWALADVKRPGLAFAMAFVAALTASVTLAAGVAVWVAVPIYWWIARPEGERRYSWGSAAIWAGGTLLSLLLYVHNPASGIYDQDTNFLINPEINRGEVSAVFKHPWKAVGFLTALLGSFAGGGYVPLHLRVAQLAGSVTVAAVAALSLYVWRCRQDRQLARAAAPWVAICGYEFGVGILVAMGRMSSHDITRALSSHYTSVGVHFLLAGFALAMVVVGDVARRAPTDWMRRLPLARTVFWALLALQIPSQINGVFQTRFETALLRRDASWTWLTFSMPPQKWYPALQSMGELRFAHFFGMEILPMGREKVLAAALDAPPMAGHSGTMDVKASQKPDPADPRRMMHLAVLDGDAPIAFGAGGTDFVFVKVTADNGQTVVLPCEVWFASDPPDQMAENARGTLPWRCYLSTDAPIRKIDACVFNLGAKRSATFATYEPGAKLTASAPR